MIPNDKIEALIKRWSSGWGAAQTALARQSLEHAAELQALLDEDVRGKPHGKCVCGHQYLSHNEDDECVVGWMVTDTRPTCVCNNYTPADGT